MHPALPAYAFDEPPIGPQWVHEIKWDGYRVSAYVAGGEHRLTKPKHPWTNGQVERMNRIIKDAT